MANKTQADKNYLSLPALRERGWTPSIIEKLLGKADTTRPNPRYRSAAPMRLYEQARVAGAECSAEFERLRARAADRRRSATAAEEQRKESVLQRARSSRIKVAAGRPQRDIIRAACRAYNAAKSGREDYEPATPDSDERFLMRIALNYVRHELTRYDAALLDQYGRIGADEARDIVRSRVVEAIVAAYPWLADAAEEYLARHAQGAGG
jgi:hypothetical protein